MTFPPMPVTSALAIGSPSPKPGMAAALVIFAQKGFQLLKRRKPCAA